MVVRSSWMCECLCVCMCACARACVFVFGDCSCIKLSVRVGLHMCGVFVSKIMEPKTSCTFTPSCVAYFFSPWHGQKLMQAAAYSVSYKRHRQHVAYRKFAKVRVNNRLVYAIPVPSWSRILSSVDERLCECVLTRCPTWSIDSVQRSFKPRYHAVLCSHQRDTVHRLPVRLSTGTRTCHSKLFVHDTIYHYNNYCVWRYTGLQKSDATTTVVASTNHVKPRVCHARWTCIQSCCSTVSAIVPRAARNLFDRFWPKKCHSLFKTMSSANVKCSPLRTQSYLIIIDRCHGPGVVPCQEYSRLLSAQLRCGPGVVPGQE